MKRYVVLTPKARGHINIKVDFTPRYITNEKTFHNEKMVNSSREHKFNIYAPNNRASKYKKQKLIEVEGDRPTNIVKSLNISLQK